MAIAFARVGYISRAKGHSAVAAIAYRSGTKLNDERTGKIENYLNHCAHVVHSEIMLPDGTDEKFRDREVLWNAVEAAEDQFNLQHKRAQVAVDHVLALPKDEALTKDDLIELTRRFARTYFVSQGVPVDFSIHDQGDGNPHAHILRATRRLHGSIFDRLKARDLDPAVRGGRVQVEQLEWEKWRDFQNAYFKEKKLKLTVDPNGIVSQLHLGKQTFHHPLRENTAHWQANEARKVSARKILLHSPEAILNQITLHRAIFTRADLAKLIDQHLTKQGITNPTVFQNVLARIEGNDQLMALGLGSDGKDYFTTRAMFEIENELQDFANYLKHRNRHQVSDHVIEQVISNRTLSNEQADAVRHLVSGLGISALLGRAGTGKSYTLGVAHDIWVQAGFRISGIALSAKAAESLASSSGIPSRTIESFRYGLASGRTKLTRNDIVVMDEAGMADSTQFREVLHAVARAGAKFVYAGDPDQTQPVGPGASMRALLERTGYVELSQVRRQTVNWMREATLALARGDAGKALSFYQKRTIMRMAPDVPADAELDMGQVVFYQTGQDYFAAFRTSDRVVRERIVDPIAIHQLAAIKATDTPVGMTDTSRLARACRYLAHMNDLGSFIHFGQDAEPTIQRLIQDWQATYLAKGGTACAIMAYTNAEVTKLNRQAREALIHHQAIREGVMVSLSSGEKKLAIGERLQFLKNDYQLGIFNGQFATVKALSRDRKGRVLGIEVQIDGADDTTLIDLAAYDHLDYGYAATVNKFQGQTVDASFIYVSGFGWDRHLAYTAMSRHRESARLYVNQASYADMNALTRQFSREALKDSLTDWPWHFRQRHGLSANDAAISKFHAKLVKTLKTHLSSLRDEIAAYFLPEAYWSRKAFEAVPATQAPISHMDAKKQQHQDAATVFKYVETAKAAGQVWAKVFEAYEKNHARFGDDYQLSDHTQYREALILKAKRDEIASVIVQDISRYDGACQYYQLDLDKLEKQAHSHVGRETVKRYLDEMAAEHSLHRNQLAYQIVQNEAAHVAGIHDHHEAFSQALKLNALDSTRAIWKQLREEARIYERQLLLQDLNDEEKTRFTTVENYVKNYQHAAQLWQQFFELANKNQIDQDLLEAAKMASLHRNELAGQIYEAFDHYRLGLNFYQIDQATPFENLYGRTSANEKHDHEYYLAKRAMKLKKYAYQAYAKKRVDDYLTARDQREKSMLADTILHYSKSHDRWIREASKLSQDTDGLSRDEKTTREKAKFFEIKQLLFKDAIFIRREKLIETLDAAGIADVTFVEQYVADDEAVREAWKQFYTKHKQEKDALVANQLAQKRDQSAITILKDITRFSPGLALYDIQIDTLEKSLQAQACRDRVAQFLNPKTAVKEKPALAAFMVENRGAHTAALSLVGVDWRTVYPYADCHVHQQIRANLAPSEQTEFHCLSQYVRLKRRLARVISQKIENKTRWTLEKQQHFDYLMAKRNAFAAQLLQIPYPTMALWEAFRLSPHQCEKHAQKHAVLVSQLQAYVHARHDLIQQLKTLVHEAGAWTSLVTAQSPAFSHFRSCWQALSQLSQQFLRQGKKLKPALSQLKLSDSLLTQDRDFLGQLHQAIALKQGTSEVALTVKASTAEIQLPQPVVLKKAEKRWDLSYIKMRLNERAQEVAMAAVGSHEVFNARKSNSQKLIWGQKGGSLQVTISGDKVGYWNDFSSTRGGGRDLLSFIQTQQNCSLKEAIDWSIQFLGLGEGEMVQSQTPKVLSVVAQQAIADETFTKQQWQRMVEAREIWQGTQPIEGTLAQRYLQTHRGIAGKLSNQYRFHPSVMNYDNRKHYPALVVAATNNKHEVQAIQAIYLDERTANKIDKKTRQKQNLGPTKGASVWLNGYKPGQPIALVEGPETAATVLEAKGDAWAVVCTLGSSNFKSLVLPKTAKHLILVQDNDGDNLKPEQSALDAAVYYAKRGVTTWRVKPVTTGEDFNDVHQKQGMEAVRHQLKQGQLCEKGLVPDVALQKLQTYLFASDVAPVTTDEHLAQARVLNRVGQTEMALAQLDQAGCLISGRRVAEAQALCLQAYLQASQQSPRLNQAIFASSTAEIKAFNEALRYMLKRQGALSVEQHIKMGEQFKTFAVGDLIRFTEDFPAKDILKNSRAKIIALKADKLTVAFSNRRQVTFQLSECQNFDYGYAFMPTQGLDSMPIQQGYAYLNDGLTQSQMQNLLASAQQIKLYYPSDRYATVDALKAAMCQRPSSNINQDDPSEWIDKANDHQQTLKPRQKPKPRIET